MINQNLIFLRKRAQLTQEQAAEKVGVSRQALANWEKGNSTPDLNSCIALADLYQVSMDDLVRHSDELGVTIPPKGKYFFGTVMVGARGQIVIPKKAREVFEINEGDQLLLLGDEERGLAILPKQAMDEFMQAVSSNETVRKEGWHTHEEREEQ